ncbi:MAG: T9SS type A sorting domain-containing protein [Polaribacter sp.]|uniref:T9SS type A sorting domain-containing protein n=1 Tax=Polaribacter sp. TaxID=1920175 RepID=UPI002F35A7A2
MKKLILAFILFLSIPLFSQTATGDIETYIDTIIDNVPSSFGEDYEVPNSTQLNNWNIIIDFLLANDLTNARSNANGLDYQVTEFTDTSISPNQFFYVLEKQSSSSNYWGTYVFSKTPIRNNLIIQAPHIKNDTNTGQQAVHCFKNTLARAVFISGTHRCNSNSFSSCSGTTSTCNSGSQSYRVSDMAHNVTTMFQKTTENLFTNISNSVFIQLHGFGKKSTDPYVIMSNGTRQTPTTDYATLIKNALLNEDSSLTFQLAHINTSWTRLIGFTNTQGRLINNSSNHCSSSATNTSGRFIHIEQEKIKLRNNSSGWTKMSNALTSVFSSTLSLKYFNLNTSISISPNPTLGRIIIRGKNVNQIEVYNLYGQRIRVKKINNENNPSIDLSKESSGIYFLKIKKNDGLALKKVIRF